MNNGWRRETAIREYTKSGIRGEVVYVAPCGKRFKQYPDIIRVSDTNLGQRERGHFSALKHGQNFIVRYFFAVPGKARNQEHQA